MRMRFKPYARPELLASGFFVAQPDAARGAWRAQFAAPSQPLHLELGCGKGGFLAQLASQNPNINYLGIDITDKVLVTAKRNVEQVYQAAQLPLDNVRLAALDIERIYSAFSAADTVQRIYINFCNPWNRKAQHEKHRLTHPRQLALYLAFLEQNGEIYFKCDDEDLYRASLGYFAASGFAVTWQTEDLHAEEPAWNLRTEHEDMYAAKGIKTKALIAVRR